MNPWKFFDTILVINLADRLDRRNRFMQEAIFTGMDNYRFIDGVKADNPTNGFNQAQRNALEACSGTSMILEDDCIFRNWQHLPQALIDLPADWDICYLGANINGSELCNWPVPIPVTEHLSRVWQAWTTHAVAYSVKGRERILKEWDHKNGQIYDDYLRCEMEKLQAYIVNPMVADQLPGFSDIWNTQTHYGFFQQGNLKMKKDE